MERRIELSLDVTGFQSVTVMGGDIVVQTGVRTLFILAVRRQQGEEECGGGVVLRERAVQSVH